MTKKTAHIVNPRRLKNLVTVTNTSKDLDVTDAQKHSFGKDRITSIIVNDIGFNCGCRKVIRSGDYVNFLATANPNLKALRTFGFKKNQAKFSIIESINI